MGNASPLRFLVVLVLAGFLPATAAHAQIYHTWVSRSGLDTNPCTPQAPCQTFAGAFGKTPAGGQINVLDAGDFGPVTIDKSITIANDTSGTATIIGAAEVNSSMAGQIVITAGAADVVTLRGLTLNVAGRLPVAGVQIFTAYRVNIEHCTIRGEPNPGILVAATGMVGSGMSVKIQDTVVTGSAAGAEFTSAPGFPVSVSIVQSSFENNNGAGVRVDGTNGGPIVASISDSVFSLNGGNGVLALSGMGNVGVHVTRTVIASNISSGVQSNQSGGGAANVTVGASVLANNANGNVTAVAGGTLLTFGDNELVGPTGTGFTGPISRQ